MLNAADTQSGITRRVRARVNNGIFRSIHGSQIIYNVCWEDPRVDRRAMQIQPDSRILVITSAGCNALEYLLDDPKEIVAVDMNPRQNALFQLKRAAFLTLAWHDVFQIFGRGWHPRFAELYATHLRPELSADAREWWDGHQHYFAGTGPRPSFHWRGSSGFLAWSLTRPLMLHSGARQAALRLFESESLEEQERHFAVLQDVFWNRATDWIVRQDAALAMVGVPRAQRELVDRQYANGMPAFIQEVLQHIFTRLPIQDNYFYRGYLLGGYTPTCCPEHLREENFETIRARVHRIKVHTNTVAGLLRGWQGPDFSHFVLLDHQDWLAHHAPDLLVDEWVQLLTRAAPGALYLMRSATMNIDFFPNFVERAITLDRPLATALQTGDRVGSYPGFVIARLNETTGPFSLQAAP